MHRLLKRQLKKLNITDTDTQIDNFENLLKLISTAYSDADEDRHLLENTLKISSGELQDLYQKLKLKSKTELAKSEEKFRQLAKTDPLTGIGNRYYFEEQLTQLIMSSKRENKKFALLFLDLDNFKHINDTFGHYIGDKLLMQIANTIQPNIRKEDVFARIGGDEFVIIFNNINNEYLSNALNKIIKLIHQYWKIDEHKLNISTSIGIAMYPNDSTSQIELMQKADIALYKAKDLGKNTFCFYTDTLNLAIHQEMALAQSMEKAIDEHQFELLYQPKQLLNGDIIMGAEALIRWNHPTKGLLSPNKFITLAENIGHIEAIGQWVIEESCRAMARFNAVSNTQLHLSLNVSPRQLQIGNLYQIVKDALAISKINPAQLFLEFTESIMINNKDKMIDRLNKIKTLGVHICMDDFGTGYSSLSYLHTLPIDSLKIDKSFIDEIAKSKDSTIIVDTIIAMGNALNLPVIAEGVETEQQRNYLLQKGCSYYQGYLFAKPLTEDEFIALIAKHPLKTCH